MPIQSRPWLGNWPRLVADTDSGEALPLLAFTLAELANGVGRGGRLSRQRYDQLGGVQGALTRQAEAALAEAIAARGRRRQEVIAGLLRLVTVDEQGRPTRWRAPRDELPEPVIQEVDAFVRRRLVATDTDNGNVVLAVTHEAFCPPGHRWPRRSTRICRHCGPVAGSSRPPPSGTLRTTHRPGCGNVANSPPP
ncbi:MAG: hypothetical protein LC799_23580 [Actinobacteria bacterium]|nr:hypothetical protein [Actinomycetota bacterium]